MYQSMRPLLSVVAALGVLGTLLLAQHYFERAPAGSLSALPTAVADPATPPVNAARLLVPAPPPAPAKPTSTGLEASLAGEALGAVGAH
jgi:hypothetical protein